jgi:hypothetical protein
LFFFRKLHSLVSSNMKILSNIMEVTRYSTVLDVACLCICLRDDLFLSIVMPFAELVYMHTLVILSSSCDLLTFQCRTNQNFISLLSLSLKDPFHPSIKSINYETRKSLCTQGRFLMDWFTSMSEMWSTGTKLSVLYSLRSKS